jgi:hypothetical protein
MRCPNCAGTNVVFNEDVRIRGSGSVYKLASQAGHPVVGALAVGIATVANVSNWLRNGGGWTCKDCGRQFKSS